MPVVRCASAQTGLCWRSDHHSNRLKICPTSRSPMFPLKNISAGCKVVNHLMHHPRIVHVSTGRYYIFCPIATLTNSSAISRSAVSLPNYTNSLRIIRISPSCCIVMRRQWWGFDTSRLGNPLPPTSSLRSLNPLDPKVGVGRGPDAS